MAIRDIVTAGFGTFSSAARIPTIGFGSAELAIGTPSAFPALGGPDAAFHDLEGPDALFYPLGGPDSIFYALNRKEL